MSYLSIPNVIAHAKSHVGGWKFVDIDRIVWTHSMLRGAYWHPPRTSTPCWIEVGWAEGDHILWHEIFHSVLHNAPLMKIDGAWGEGLCNAFHGVNEQVFHHGPGFPTDIDYLRAKSNPDDGDLARYRIPCALILHRVNRDPYLFREWFLDMNRDAEIGTTPLLTREFGYDPATGRRV